MIDPARDIQEVRNAISAYDALSRWDPSHRQHLLEAHGVLMAGLIDAPDRFRSGGVGISQGLPITRCEISSEDSIGSLSVERTRLLFAQNLHPPPLDARRDETRQTPTSQRKRAPSRAHGSFG